jgi:hypothetical protein
MADDHLSRAVISFHDPVSRRRGTAFEVKGVNHMLVSME